MSNFINKSNPRRNSGFTLIEILITIIVVSIGLLGLAGLQISGLRANMGSEARSKATIMANDIAERMHANPLGVDANNYANISTANQNCGTLPSPFCSNYNIGTTTTEVDGITTTVTVDADGTVTTVTTAVDDTVTTETTTADDTTSTMISAADCSTPLQMATFDTWIWTCGMPVANGVQRGGVLNQLLNGSATVTCDDNPCLLGSAHTISVNWSALNPDSSNNEDNTATLNRTYTLVMVP
jgi:type IV pilus assembly protein PilV